LGCIQGRLPIFTSQAEAAQRLGGLMVSVSLMHYEHYEGYPIDWAAVEAIIVASVIPSVFLVWHQKAIKEIGIPCFGYTQIPRARLFDFEGRLGVLRLLIIKHRHDVKNWQVASDRISSGHHEIMT
jgi:hypothetical protein